MIETPFLAFAAVLPFVASGERVHLLGIPLSVPGLYGARNVLAEGTLGVAVSILLAATTELREILPGLDITLLMVTHDLPYALLLRPLIPDSGVVVADAPPGTRWPTRNC